MLGRFMAKFSHTSRDKRVRWYCCTSFNGSSAFTTSATSGRPEGYTDHTTPLISHSGYAGTCGSLNQYILAAQTHVTLGAQGVQISLQCIQVAELDSVVHKGRSGLRR